MLECHACYLLGTIQYSDDTVKIVLILLRSYFVELTDCMSSATVYASKTILIWNYRSGNFSSVDFCWTYMAALGIAL